MEQIDFDTELALKLSKIVHDKCQNTPHDIGVILAQEVTLHNLQKAGISGAKVREQFYNEFMERREKKNR